MAELCERSPFQLKKDLKELSDTALADIQEHVANELCYGKAHPPTYANIYVHPSKKCLCAKIRTEDAERNAGKSGGYRCIVLIDNVNQCAYILHIYRHSHGERDNISQHDRNMLRALVDAYADALEQQHASAQ